MDGMNLEDLIAANLGGQSIDDIALQIDQLDRFINGIDSDVALQQQPQQQQQQLLQADYASTPVCCGTASTSAALPLTDYGGCNTSVSLTNSAIMGTSSTAENASAQWYFSNQPTDPQGLLLQPPQPNGNITHRLATSGQQQQPHRQSHAAAVLYAQQVATPGHGHSLTANNGLLQQPYQLGPYQLSLIQPQLSVPASISSASQLLPIAQGYQPQFVQSVTPNDVYIKSGDRPLPVADGHVSGGKQQLPIQTTPPSAMQSSTADELEKVAIASLSQQLSLLVGAILRKQQAQTALDGSSQTRQQQRPCPPMETDLNWSQHTTNSCPTSTAAFNAQPMTSRAMRPDVDIAGASELYRDLDMTVVRNGAENVQLRPHSQIRYVSCSPDTDVDLTGDSMDWIEGPPSSSSAAGSAAVANGVYIVPSQPRRICSDEVVRLNPGDVTSVFPYTPPDSSGSDSHSPQPNEADRVLAASPCDAKALGSQFPILQHVTLAGQSGLDQQRARARRPASAVGQQEPSSAAAGVANQRSRDISPTEYINPVGHVPKKRKSTTSSTTHASLKNKKNKELDLKCEVVECSEDDDGVGNEADMTSLCGTQIMQWNEYQSTKWVTLLDETGNATVPVNFRVEADKGFNFQFYDDAFVCQKKNHFQLTIQVAYMGPKQARYIKQPGTGAALLPIDGFNVNLHGIKMDIPTYQINIEQSSADRTRHSLEPVSVQLECDRLSKTVIQRLHFSETTANNMRKRGRPNPDQRYFQLVVSLYATHRGNQFVVSSFVSDKIIVRASNPGQFENDPEMSWIKGKQLDSIFHVGNVGINTDNADEALTVHGNIHVTGKLVAPSDVRVKKDIRELDTTTQLQNIKKLKVYAYEFNDEFAEYANLPAHSIADTGVLAQDVQQVIPEAVVPTGDVTLSNGEVIEDLLVVNKDRIFFENIGAVKELCKVTNKLEMRLDQMEQINQKLSQFKRTASTRTNVSTISSTSTVCHRHRKMSCRVCGGCHSSHAAAAAHTTSDATKMSKKKRCTARVIHVTAIVLVIIMSICVSAIAALYVLGKTTPLETVVGEKNSSSTTPSSNSNIISNNSQSSDENNSTINIYNTYDQNNNIPPINVVSCSLPQNTCTVVCCPSVMLSKPTTPAPEPLDMNTTSASLNNSDVATEVLQQIVDVTATTPIPTTTALREISTSSDPDIVTTTATSTIMNTTEPGAEPESTTKYAKTIINTTELETFPVSNGDYGPLTSNQPTFESQTDVTTTDTQLASDILPRNKRDDNLQQLLDIFLLEADMKVTPEYCMTLNCQQAVGGNFTYFIPINATFPRTYLTVNFRPQFSSPEPTIVLCNARYNTACGVTSDTADAQNNVQWSWTLPVGLYLSSAYTFRMTTTGDYDTDYAVCMTSSSLVGYEFIEYNLYFARMCS